MANIGLDVVNATRGQRDINLHVISETVIEWLQSWRAVVCCSRVMGLSSGVCERESDCAGVCVSGKQARRLQV